MRVVPTKNTARSSGPNSTYHASPGGLTKLYTAIAVRGPAIAKLQIDGGCARKNSTKASARSAAGRSRPSAEVLPTLKAYRRTRAFWLQPVFTDISRHVRANGDASVA